MSTLTAGNLIDRASKLLQDTTNVRWPRTELLDWLNDGQRVVVLLLPDAYTATDTVSASTAGQTTFSIPATGIRLIDVIHNTGGSLTAIRQIDRSVLDTQYPTWRSSSASAEAKHFAFDKRNPKVFYLYPPLNNSAGVKVVYSAAPAALTSENDLILLDDVFGTALVDFMVYRAYLKDAEYSANDTRAKGAYETFIGSLTGKRAADQFAVPTEDVVIAGVRHSPYRV